jgi:drug/metabolite transporter (DMT)-like permease
MNKQKTNSQAVLILMAAAVVMSFSPVIVKLLSSDAMGPTTIAFWRTLIGSLALLVMVKIQKLSMRMAKNPLTWCILTGLFFFADLSIWHRAILIVGSGMSTLLGNTHIFATAAVSYFVFKEKPSLRFFLSTIIAIGGLSLLVGIFSKEVEFTPFYIRGVLFGFTTAFMYALYIVGIKKAGNHSSNPAPAVIMAWLCISATFFLFIGSLFEPTPLLPPNLKSISLLLVLGILGQAVAWWAAVHAIKQLPIHRAALILLLQPVLSMIWGILFFEEHLTAQQLVGAAITLLAIYAGSTQKKAPRLPIPENN